MTLTYNRPDQHNAVDRTMNVELFMRRDPHTLGAAAFKAGNLTPEWPHHGL